MTITFLEPYAGSAAVAMRLLGNKRTAAPYMGNKRALAPAILREMGLADAPPERVEVRLADVGPWAWTWRALRARGGAERVAQIVEGWLSRNPDPADVYAELSGGDVPVGLDGRAAQHLALQTLSYGQKPVGTRPGSWRSRWVTHGLHKTHAYGAAKTERFGGVLPQLPRLPDRLRGLARLDQIRSVRGSAEILLDDSVRGAYVYLDPPYVGTTGYGRDAGPRAAHELARALLAYGARVVAISEAAPAPGLGGRTTVLKRHKGRLSQGRDRIEYLTIREAA